METEPSGKRKGWRVLFNTAISKSVQTTMQEQIYCSRGAKLTWIVCLFSSLRGIKRPSRISAVFSRQFQLRKTIFEAFFAKVHALKKKMATDVCFSDNQLLWYLFQRLTEANWEPSFVLRCTLSRAQEHTKRWVINKQNEPALRSAAVQSSGAAPGGCSADPAAWPEPGQLISPESQHPPAATNTHPWLWPHAKADFSDQNDAQMMHFFT